MAVASPSYREADAGPVLRGELLKSVEPFRPIGRFEFHGKASGSVTQGYPVSEIAVGRIGM